MITQEDIDNCKATPFEMWVFSRGNLSMQQYYEDMDFLVKEGATDGDDICCREQSAFEAGYAAGLKESK